MALNRSDRNGHAAWPRMGLASKTTFTIVAFAAVAVLPSAHPASGQDYQQLVIDALNAGYESFGLPEQANPGPVWLDSAQINGLFRSVGAGFFELSAKAGQVYPGATINLISSYEDVLDKGVAGDPRLERLVALAESRQKVQIPRPDASQADRSTVWIRDGGIYASVRQLSPAEVEFYKLRPRPTALVVEVTHKISSWFFMPVGERVVFEANWLDGRWFLTELGKKIS